MWREPSMTQPQDRTSQGRPHEHSTREIALAETARTSTDAMAETQTYGPPALSAPASPAPVADPARPNGIPPQVGSVIKHYELIRKLGQGGMGMVSRRTSPHSA